MKQQSSIPRTRGWGVALAFATAAISGVAVFLNKYGLRRVPNPTVYTTAKNLVAAILLGLLLAAATRARSADGYTRPTSRAQWFGLLAVGLLGGGVAFVCFFEGLARLSSPDAAFIHKTLVIWVAFLAVPLLRERLGALHFLAIGLLVLGEFLRVEDFGAIEWGRGETLVLVATWCWAVEVVIAKRLLGGLSPLTVGTARMGIGVVALVGWVAVRGNLDVLADMTAAAWGWALLTGVVLTAYVATWYSALARAQAVDVTAALVPAAVLTAILDALVEDVALAPDRAGLVVIALGGVAAGAAALRSPSRERAPA